MTRTRVRDWTHELGHLDQIVPTLFGHVQPVHNVLYETWLTRRRGLHKVRPAVHKHLPCLDRAPLHSIILLLSHSRKTGFVKKLLHPAAANVAT